MIENKTALYALLNSNIGKPLTEETVADVMHYIMTSEFHLNDEIAKWIGNCNKLMRKLHPQ